jgi:hypothetical protein
MKIDSPHFKMKILWNVTKDGEFPYDAVIENVKLVVRVNDWPTYPTVYSLLVDDRVYDFNDWPSCWRRDLPLSFWTD